jgi:putative transposase
MLLNQIAISAFRSGGQVASQDSISMTILATLNVKAGGPAPDFAESIDDVLVLAHDRRRILHVAVTAHPTAEWTAQQLREVFPWDSAPQYLLRDRDRIFGGEFTNQVKELGIRELLGAPGVPQQRAYIERVIGTIRRECLDHLIVFDEASLLRHLKLFLAYYHETRTHLSLEKDTPGHRAVQEPASGRIVAIPQVGGLHHRYERRAA